MLFVYEVKVFDDEIMLRDSVDVVVGEENILGVIKLKVQTNKFLMFSFDGFSGECTTSQFNDLDIELEHDHAVLPPLQGYDFGGDGVQLDEDVVFEVRLLVMEAGRKIMLLAVGYGVVGLFDAVAMEQL